jgi:hypothetical protein
MRSVLTVPLYSENTRSVTRRRGLPQHSGRDRQGEGGRMGEVAGYGRTAGQHARPGDFTAGRLDDHATARARCVAPAPDVPRKQPPTPEPGHPASHPVVGDWRAEREHGAPQARRDPTVVVDRSRPLLPAFTQERAHPVRDRHCRLEAWRSHARRWMSSPLPVRIWPIRPRPSVQSGTGNGMRLVYSGRA